MRRGSTGWDGVEGCTREPLRVAVVAVVALVVQGVGVAPVRGMLLADRTVGVDVTGMTMSILICVKNFILIIHCSI